jgi:hypothetical protein
MGDRRIGARGAIADAMAIVLAALDAHGAMAITEGARNAIQAARV